MAGKDAKFAYANGTDKTALVDKKTKRYPHEELKTGYSRRALYGKKFSIIAKGEYRYRYERMHVWSRKRERMTMPSFKTNQCLVPLKPRSRMTCEQSALVLGRSASEIPTCGDEPLFC